MSCSALGCYRFVVSSAGHDAYVEYELREKLLDLTHTYTPPELRGQGLAAKVVQVRGRAWLVD